MRPSTSHLRDLVRKRDFYAGGLMILLGLGIALKGVTYRLGSPMHMGPGFFPTSLGGLLVLVGIAIAAPAFTLSASGDGHGDSILPEHPEWFAWFCILLSPVLFIAFGQFGMVPGTFACVFIPALGDRTATLRGTFILSAIVTVFGAGLFSYFLQVPLPIVTGYWGLAVIPFLFGLAGYFFAKRINRDEKEWFVFCFFLPMIGPIPHLFGLAGSTLAKQKNRNKKLWFAVCFFLSVIGGAIGYISFTLAGLSIPTAVPVAIGLPVLGLILIALLPAHQPLAAAPHLSKTTG